MINQDKLMYLTCEMCVQEMPNSQSIREFSRLSVAATCDGSLVVACERHLIVVALIANRKVAGVLRSIGATECECGNCGEHGTASKKETLH